MNESFLKIWGCITAQLKYDFKWSTYAVVFVFIFIILFANYQLDFEDGYLDTLTGLWCMAGYFVTYLVIYAVATVIVLGLSKETHLITRGFVIQSLVGIGLLAVTRGFTYVSDWTRNVDYAIQTWLIKVTFNTTTAGIIILGLWIRYSIKDRSTRFYGMFNTRIDWRPYWIMLLIMVPIVIAASFTRGFQQKYPMYYGPEVGAYFNIPDVFPMMAYELVYALNFVSVELLFRGFFVIGMVSYLGRRSILPMAVLYCSIHFGKPLGEAISSIFGGFILGAIAFETRSIYGGIAIHIGIAWLMELCAYLIK